jgi:hypothetical protein
MGGALSPPITIDTRYDARGNMVYKSDVGRYWYDPARPNRLINITLENFAGAVPNTGKRNLSYVYDDFAPSAKNIQGSPLGNGNLMYTVSHDVASLGWSEQLYREPQQFESLQPMVNYPSPRVGVRCANHQPTKDHKRAECGFFNPAFRRGVSHT